VLEKPAYNFSLELGDFLVKEQQAGDVTIVVAFDRESTTLPAAVREQIQQTVRESIEFFSETFGPYPLDYLTVATAPRDFSQGFLGFVTLSDAAMASSFGRRHIIPHELAHQWWGNLVGWNSYRDQWLSEATANYAAVLFARHKAKGRRSPFGPFSRWRASLLSTTDDGRSVESLGPIVLGARLSSSRYPGAYQPIVYDKGAMVLDMLARSFKEDQFLDMLEHLVDAAQGRQLSTEEFLAALERMSGVNLDAFARQYVYGTGIPEIYYSYEFEKGEEDWTIRGEARQSALYHQEYGVVRTPEGRLDVESRRIDEADVESSNLIVPFQVQARAGEEEFEGADDEDGKFVLMEGRLPIRGAGSTFRIDSGRKPIRFWLDKNGEVLALFYSESREPKRVLMYQGMDLAAAGDTEMAEATFRRALGAPLFVASEVEDVMARREKRGGRVVDFLIHLHLAQLFLDADRDEEAQAELDAAEKLMDPYIRVSYEDFWNRIRSRLEIRAGDFDGTYKRFRFVMRDYWRPPTEDLLLLAIAAGETGHDDVREQALVAARRQGADVDLLE
jgi:hypothetical protein